MTIYSRGRSGESSILRDGWPFDTEQILDELNAGKVCAWGDCSNEIDEKVLLCSKHFGRLSDHDQILVSEINLFIKTIGSFEENYLEVLKKEC